MKRIMMLGGNLIQTTAIKAAKECGYYVITVDNRPSNPGHKFSDEYHYVSTVDKDEVLDLAKKMRIDGIASYGSDISAPTAAYVAENMGLPTNPYRAVMILTHKDLFRQFLKENGYDTPKFGVFDNFGEAKKYLKNMKNSAIVKPVDSSGSKGVNKISDEFGLKSAWRDAITLSREKKVLVEDFIESTGYQIDGDIFVNEGEIVFNGLCDQHHDCGCAPYTPSGLSYPSIQDKEVQDRALRQIQDIFRKLNINMGAFNIEYLVDKQGEIHLIEIGPRNGGNLITDIINEVTGVNLASYTVRQSVGDDFIGFTTVKRGICSCSYIIHSDHCGIFQGLEINPTIKDAVKYCNVTIKIGDTVNVYQDSSQGIGLMILNFDSIERMLEVADNMGEYVKVKTKPLGGGIIYDNRIIADGYYGLLKKEIV